MIIRFVVLQILFDCVMVIEFESAMMLREDEKMKTLRYLYSILVSIYENVYL